MGSSGAAVKPWLRTILIFPAFVIVVGLFEFIAYSVQGINPIKEPIKETLFQKTLGAFISLFGTVLVVWLFTRFIDKIRFKDLGFSGKGMSRQLVTGLLLGILIIGAGFVTLAMFQQINWQINKFDPVSLLCELLLLIFVAVSEEIISRGYVLNNLMQSMGKGWALAVSAMMFSILHVLNPDFSWIGFFNIFLAGILLGIPYMYTKQLWLPIGLHFSWNFFQGPVFGFNVSGIDLYSMITQTRTTDTIWNGGNFGFEGSLLSIVFMLPVIGGMWYYFNSRLKIEALDTNAAAIAEVE